MCVHACVRMLWCACVCFDVRACVRTSVRHCPPAAAAIHIHNYNLSPPRHRFTIIILLLLINNNYYYYYCCYWFLQYYCDRVETFFVVYFFIMSLFYDEIKILSLREKQYQFTRIRIIYLLFTCARNTVSTAYGRTNRRPSFVGTLGGVAARRHSAVRR